MKDRRIGKKAAALLLAIALLCGIASGCGGDDSSSSSSASAGNGTFAADETMGSSANSKGDITNPKKDITNPKGEITNPKGTEQQSGKLKNTDSQFSSCLKGSIDENSFEGVAYLTENGGEVYSSGDNITDLYRVASVSKQFTAAAVLMLYEDGKLDITSSIEKYFPEYSHAGEITIHQLMCMSSGIPDYIVMADGIASPEQTYSMSAENSSETNRSIIKNWVFNRDLIFTPGTQNYYCNTNYLLLAEIVTKAAGMPYEKYIEQKMLAPLGMTSTGFGDTWNGGSVVEKAGENYEWFRYKGICYGCADMISNAVDLEKWGHEFIDNKVLSDSIINLMTQDYSGGYGYGIIPDAQSGFVYHDGNLPPYTSTLCVGKSRGLVLVMLDCSSSSSLSSVRQSVFDIVKN